MYTLKMWSNNMNVTAVYIKLNRKVLDVTDIFTKIYRDKDTMNR